MIAELCPNGVEYLGLREVTQVLVGGDLPANFAKGQKEPTEQFPYPIYSNGIGDAALYGFTDDYKIEKEAVTISARGTIGYHTVREGKFTPIVRLITLVANENKITTKFLNYALYVAGIEGVSTGIPSLTVPMLDKFKIPVPALIIQQEIVRILDKFTELTAELVEKLTAELTTRKKQYEYYRDLLLTFDEKCEQLNRTLHSSRVAWVTLGEVGEFVRGNGLQKKDFTESGFPCVHYGQIHTKYGLYANRTFTYVNSKLAEKLRKAQYNDLLIATTSENIEYVCRAVAWLGSDVAISGDMMYFRSNQNVKYLAYVFQTSNFFEQKQRYAHGTKVIRVSRENLQRIQIPLPPLDEQERIVTILDRFDALTTSLTNGIPAEINARQKQYEYYRNKLLTFDCHCERSEAI